MTITESRIKEMAESGYPAMIEHHRILKDTGKPIKTYNNSRSKEKYGKKPDYAACGGWTVVRIGMISKPFIAECSKKDHFCFKDGTFLAVSRAYTYFKEHCEEMEHGAAIQQEVPQSKSCCGGSCCKDCDGITEEEEGTYKMVLEDDTKFSIVCVNPNTQEFLGYLPKNDGYVIEKVKPDFKMLCVGLVDKDYYTSDVKEAAEFDTKEEAQGYLVHSEEHVIQVNYKLIGQVRVTDV